MKPEQINYKNFYYTDISILQRMYNPSHNQLNKNEKKRIIKDDENLDYSLVVNESKNLQQCCKAILQADAYRVPRFLQVFQFICKIT